jgi:hypothetical protein
MTNTIIIYALLQIHGVGPATILEFVKEYNFDANQINKNAYKIMQKINSKFDQENFN